MNEVLRRELLTVGWVAAAAVALFTTLWVVALAMDPGPPVDAAAADQLAYLRDAGLAGAPAVLFSLPLAFLFVPVWLGLAALIWERRPGAGVLAVCSAFFTSPSSRSTIGAS